MKMVLFGRPGGESDVIVRTASEFPPIHVTKWISSLGERVLVQYGRARLKSGFIYFYVAEDQDEGKRFDDTIRLVRGLPASVVLMPPGLEKSKVTALMDAAQASHACLAELAGSWKAGQDAVVSRKAPTERVYRAVTQFEFTAVIHERGQLSVALWELYQAVRAEANG
jgi:hypothetical protein